LLPQNKVPTAINAMMLISIPLTPLCAEALMPSTAALRTPVRTSNQACAPAAPRALRRPTRPKQEPPIQGAAPSGVTYLPARHPGPKNSQPKQSPTRSLPGVSF
jgi:hypothetical protein